MNTRLLMVLLMVGWVAALEVAVRLLAPGRPEYLFLGLGPSAIYGVVVARIVDRYGK